MRVTAVASRETNDALRARLRPSEQERGEAHPEAEKPSYLHNPALTRPEKESKAILPLLFNEGGRAVLKR